MGTGDRQHVSFHLHLPHLHGFHHHRHHHGSSKEDDLKDILKGCFAVMVGQGEEQQQRFVIPVVYINHPLFMQLLKEAEDEYGFDQEGPIAIPCHVQEFRNVQGMIDKEHHHHNHHHHHHHIWCFRV